MPQSLARLLVHIVFSTKNREPWLDDALRPELFAYMAVIGRNNGCEVFRVGSVNDHAHLAIDRQEEHHRKIGFQEEFRRLLAKNGKEGGERYLWD